MIFIDSILEAVNEIKEKDIFELAELYKTSNKIHLFGNGGSASICSHLSVDLTKTCNLKAFTYHDPSLITCFANDYGYANIFVNIIEKFVDPKDLVVAISSKGESKNILNAVNTALNIGAKVIALSGFSLDNSLNKTNSNLKIHVDSTNYNVVETIHQTILLAGCERLVSN